MALAQINATGEAAPKKSKLEIFAQGLNIANGVGNIVGSGYGMYAKDKELSMLEKYQQAMLKKQGGA